MPRPPELENLPLYQDEIRRLTDPGPFKIPVPVPVPVPYSEPVPVPVTYPHGPPGGYKPFNSDEVVIVILGGVAIKTIEFGTFVVVGAWKLATQ
jgi:hypothetical protein